MNTSNNEELNLAQHFKVSNKNRKDTLNFIIKKLERPLYIGSLEYPKGLAKAEDMYSLFLDRYLADGSPKLTLLSITDNKSVVKLTDYVPALSKNLWDSHNAIIVRDHGNSTGALDWMIESNFIFPVPVAHYYHRCAHSLSDFLINNIITSARNKGVI